MFNDGNDKQGTKSDVSDITIVANKDVKAARDFQVLATFRLKSSSGSAEAPILGERKGVSRDILP